MMTVEQSRWLARPRIYRRLWSYARPSRPAIFAALAAAAAAALAAAIYPYLVGPLFKALLTDSAARVGTRVIDRRNLTLAMPVIVVAVAAFKALAQLAQTGLMQAAGQRVMSRLRGDLYRHLLEL